MSTSFKLSPRIRAAGWLYGAGHVLRSLPACLGVLMRDPTLPGPLVRVIRRKRVTRLDIRLHDASRCTVGRWETIDIADTPTHTRAWGDLLEFWCWYVDEWREGRSPWVWADCRGKDPNRCRTRADANRLAPSPAGGPGRGRKGKTLPGGMAIFGYSPATGKNCVTKTHKPVPSGTTGLEVDLRESIKTQNDADWFKGLNYAARR